MGMDSADRRDHCDKCGATEYTMYLIKDTILCPSCHKMWQDWSNKKWKNWDEKINISK